MSLALWLELDLEMPWELVARFGHGSWPENSCEALHKLCEFLFQWDTCYDWYLNTTNATRLVWSVKRKRWENRIVTDKFFKQALLVE